MGLAEYIRDDLLYRIEAGDELPCKLTLPGLAKHYNVSLTPVRTAINDLVAEGVLLKRPNGRVEIGALPKKRSRSAKVIAPPRSARDWDRDMLREVMLASLHGESVYLREESLAQKLDVGRSVVRQSLGRLAGAGLIEHVPRCGWLVHPIEEEDVRAYLDVRESLELKALDLARPRLEQARLESLLEGNPTGDDEHEPGLDNRLHLYLVECAGNRYIEQFFEQYTAAFYTDLFDHAAPEAHVVAEMAGQHREILEALIEKKWPVARKALANHIQSQFHVLHRILPKNGRKFER